MDKVWNLSPAEWSAALGSDANPAVVANDLARNERFVPWTDVLVAETHDCATTLDLGSGRGEHSAVLGRRGRIPTLADWSEQNLLFSRQMFAALGLRGRFCRFDLTRPLPFASDSIDAVFSCGVFEYFTDQQVDTMIAEAFRVARKRVIVCVPNAWSLAYRIGMWHKQRRGAWGWGGEVPFYTLRDGFRRAGATNVREFSVASRHALDFLEMRGSRIVKRVVSRLCGAEDPATPSLFRQGYLLVTIGDRYVR